ncbi:hypothetical protein ACFX14_041434 [Malus domestica]
MTAYDDILASFDDAIADGVDVRKKKEKGISRGLERKGRKGIDSSRGWGGGGSWWGFWGLKDLVHCRTSSKPFYAILHRVEVGLVIDLEPVWLSTAVKFGRCGSPSPSAPASPAAEFGSPPPSNLVGRARMFEFTGLSILALESSHFRYFPSQSSGPQRLEILVPQVVTRQI